MSPFSETAPTLRWMPRVSSWRPKQSQRESREKDRCQGSDKEGNTDSGGWQRITADACGGKWRLMSPIGSSYPSFLVCNPVIFPAQNPRPSAEIRPNPRFPSLSISSQESFPSHGPEEVPHIAPGRDSLECCYRLLFRHPTAKLPPSRNTGRSRNLPRGSAEMSPSNGLPMASEKQ